MAKIVENIYGRKVGGVRVVSTSVKIILVFTIFLLVSNLSSNYINLVMNQAAQIKLINRLLVRDLKDIHVFASNQFEIFQYSHDEQEAMDNIVQSALGNMKYPSSVALGLREDGTLAFYANQGDKETEAVRLKSKTIEGMVEKLNQGKKEDTLSFDINGKNYLGVYKYNDKWDIFILRAEKQSELYSQSRRIFLIISIIIFLITIACTVIGIYIIRYILRFIKIMTDQIMVMEQEQKMGLLDLEGAVNDDVSYLGMAFNSLSNTIDNLVTIFKKFVARDVAARAYEEKDIRLEGVKRELAVLFTDIKGFTYMTETLGTDIIKLLNIHYDKAIHHILQYNGDIGSIIGDALLAIFGIGLKEGDNKSLLAVQAGYKVLDVAADLRQEMYKYEAEIIRTRGYMNDLEKKIFKAVLIQVGVGIDGGEVFYGNIGSTDRMVNTVIGDNVNSSSRLEGLTRFYKVPIIVSEYIKDDIEKDTDEYLFVEIDQVKVKGKTEGKHVYWPLRRNMIDSDLKDQVESFSKGLEKYYSGEWREAEKFFTKCLLPLKDVFSERITGREAPGDWNGVWAMTEK